MSGKFNSFVQRLVIGGRRLDPGPGLWPVVTLQDARLAALENRRKARAGPNPFTERRRYPVPTFRQAAESALEANRPRLSRATARTWQAQLANHAFRDFGGRRVDTITRQDV